MERALRVHTLCCTSAEHDWQSQGQALVPGQEFLLRLQHHQDGRCGSSGDGLIHVRLGGVPLTVYRYSPASLATIVATVPPDTPLGNAALRIEYRGCAWTGAATVMLAPEPKPPPLPTISADGVWLRVPGYGASVWRASVVTDVGLGPWIRLPQPDSGRAWFLCAIDTTGRSHGAWRLTDTFEYGEVPAGYDPFDPDSPDWPTPRITRELESYPFAPCDTQTMCDPTLGPVAGGCSPEMFP